MDFGAFGVWWDSQAWGTVADWFGAVGTVAAFALAVGILLRDSKLRQRSSADRFVTFTTASMTATGPAMHNYKLQVFAHNAGDAPVPVALVKVMSEGAQLAQASFENANRTFEIAPKTQVQLEIPLGDTDVSDCKAVVAFKDERGQWWYRDIISNKYMSKRSYEKITKRPRTR